MTEQGYHFMEMCFDEGQMHFSPRNSSVDQ